MKAQDYVISSEKFTFHSMGDKIHDTKLETRPMSYFKDALHRFAKNKASIAAAVIIGILILFAIIGPMCTPYKVIDEDAKYRYVLPKNELFVKMGIHFWDGTTMKEVNKMTYDQYQAIEDELGREVIIGDVTEKTIIEMKKEKTVYEFRLDTYEAVGAEFLLKTYAEYKAIQDYQDETGILVILPVTDEKLRPVAEQDKANPNIWYATTLGDGSKTSIVYDENGKLIPIYKEYSNGADDYTSKVRYEEGAPKYDYAVKKSGGMYEIRVDYKTYYTYYHTRVLKDGITKASFLFGATDAGKDIFTCLSSGARFSFILAIIVAVVNLLVGAIYGAIEGYYGGKIDLLMERFVDILGAVPTMIVISLLKYNLGSNPNISLSPFELNLLILFISFFATGWIGMASRTRMQFYRFKNQEYVLVARTLGARDRRIMFKHIFPNAIGTLITGSVLVIPGVIFSETSLTYLNIIDLNTGSMTSVGTLLAKGQANLFTYPHMILTPALFISLLMLSFNLFGNGLRDAFNPSLRGTEE